MTGADRFARVKALFLAAFDRAPEERATYLDTACGDDPTLRDEVDALLRHHDEESAAEDANAVQIEPLSPGQVLADRYRIVSRLGRGGMGEVFRAEDLRLGVPVALKVLRSESPIELERLLEEVRLAREVSHPAVCRVFDVGEADGHSFLTMEYVEGEDLASLLRRIGRLPSTKVRELAGELCAGLAAAHARGVLHRDLKPANVMLDAAGRAHILDFGIAVRDGGPALGLAGTPAYMAPEQLTSDAPATEQTDVYALGLVLYELLTGQPVFPVTSFEERVALGTVHPPPPSERGAEVDAALEEGILRALRPDPGGRPTSVLALARLLGVDLAGPQESDTATAAFDTAGERRHLTVMHCTLVDANHLAEALDAEAYVRALRSFRSGCEKAVARYDGHVAQYQGDGVLVYFGYPRAHEQDAERAVCAALEIANSLETLADGDDVKLAARVGIHTGSVVVTSSGARDRNEMLALGIAPKLAGELQAMATPGEVLVSEATQALVAGLFLTEDRGALRVEGLGRPVRVHRVLGSSGLRSRLERAPTLTRFVGRSQELGLLLERFDQVEEGRGQVVLISGEAGIGKSRLVHELRGRLQDRPHTWLECRTTPYTKTTPLFPVVELLERILDLQETDSIEDKVGKLEQSLAEAGLTSETARPLFAALLSLDIRGRSEPLALSPQLRRTKTLEALLGWLLSLAEKQPLVLFVEDLHWADPSTVEWLGLLIDQCPATRLLLLLTFRPELQPPWAMRGHLLPVALGRLARRDTEHLVGAAAPDEALASAVVERIAVRSDGIPLFVEELAKAFVESGRGRDGPHAEGGVPETLQDSLMARLDRLGAGKAVAQLAAALGREFPYALLEAVAPLPPGELEYGLARLVEAELLYQRGLPPAATYTFKHALVQDTAYDSMLEGQRKELHGRIADALEAGFADRVASQPEAVAWHCEQAGRAADAVRHYQRAGERATDSSAHAEAVAYLDRAVTLLGTLPESSERDQEELQLQLALGAPLQATRGMYAPEVEQAYERALDLSRTLSDETERFRTLAGLATFYRNREVVRAHELGEELLADAERTGEPSQLLFAHSTLGVVLHFRGELSKALAHDEQAIALYDPADQAWLESIYGLDPGVVSLCLASFARLQLGYPERALRTVEQAIEQARSHAHAYSLAYSLNWAAVIGYLRGEAQVVLQRTDEGIEISRQRGLAQQLGGALFFRAWALAVIADAKTARRAVDELPESLSAGGPVGAPFVSAACDARLRLEQLDAALDFVDACLEHWAALHAPYWDPEFLRMRGEIRLAQDPAAHAEAERSFLRSIEVSRRQEGKWLELRAAVSLARLWQRQGRKEEAHAFLAPVYGWFTEGFETADLRDAQALLEELA